MLVSNLYSNRSIFFSICSANKNDIYYWMTSIKKAEVQPYRNTITTNEFSNPNPTKSTVKIKRRNDSSEAFILRKLVDTLLLLIYCL